MTRAAWGIRKAASGSSDSASCGATTTNSDVTSHYVDESSDSPSWTTTKTSSGSTTTFNATDLTGGLIATISGTTITQHVADLRGNITLTTTTGLANATITSYDEYGNTNTDPKTRPANAWHGQQQRTTNSTTGLIHMGVRLYNSITGLFLQQDPVHGGNPNTYTHPVDPINKMDLTGKFWEELWEGASLAASILTIAAVIAGAPVTGPLALGLGLLGASVSAWNAGAKLRQGLSGGGFNSREFAWDLVGVATSFVGAGVAWKSLKLTHKYARWDKLIGTVRRWGQSRPGKKGSLMWLNNREVTRPLEWSGNAQAGFDAFGVTTYRKPKCKS